MDLNSFKNLRERYLSESLEYNDNPRLYEFFVSKYADQAINEGIFTSVINWFKRNFSPTARKIQELGVEYYDWLMSEYNATYKGNDSDEKEIDKFLKTEKISSDIEQEINDAAGDSEVYKKLAKKVISKYKIKAKKDFSYKLLGPTADLSKSFDSALSQMDKDLQSQLDKMSSEQSKNFKKVWEELVKKLRSQGRPKDVANLLASGLMKFFQNKLSTRAEKYSLDDIMKEYDNGEDSLITGDKFFNTVKGAQLLYAARVFQHNKFKSPKNKMTLSGMEIKEWVEKLLKDLKTAGIEDPKEMWGFTLLLASQRNAEEAKKTLELIKNVVSGKSPETLKSISSELERDVMNALQSGDTVESQNLLIDRVEKKLGDDQDKEKPGEEKPSEEKPGEEKSSEEKPGEEKPSEEKPGEEKSSEEKPDEEKNYVKVKSLIEDLQDAQTSEAASNIVESILKGIATAKLNKNNKVYLSKSYVNDPSLKMIARQFDKGDHQELLFKGKPMSSKDISQIRSAYDLKVEQDGKVTYNDKVKVAADSLVKDIINMIDVHKEKFEKMEEKDIKILKSPEFVSSLFIRGKNFSSDPIDKNNLEATFGNLFKEEFPSYF